VEQRTTERAFFQPQQEHARQPQQQYRISARQSARLLSRLALIETGVLDIYEYQKRVSGCPWYRLQACQDDAAE
jgi:hypothetical protein